MHVLAQPLLFSNASPPADTGIITFEGLGVGAPTALPGTYYNSAGLTFNTADYWALNPDGTNPMPSASNFCVNRASGSFSITVDPAKGYKTLTGWFIEAGVGLRITVTDNLGNGANVDYLPAGSPTWSAIGTLTCGIGVLATLPGVIALLTFSPLAAGAMGIDDIRLQA